MWSTDHSRLKRTNSRQFNITGKDPVSQVLSILYTWTWVIWRGFSFKKKTLNVSFLCVRQLAPCCPVACGQVATTCRGWSQALCLSLATGPCSLTVVRPAAVLGAAAMNRKLHRWVFGFFLSLSSALSEVHHLAIQVSCGQIPHRFPSLCFHSDADSAYYLFFSSQNKAMVMGRGSGELLVGWRLASQQSERSAVKLCLTTAFLKKQQTRLAVVQEKKPWGDKAIM